MRSYLSISGKIIGLGDTDQSKDYPVYRDRKDFVKKRKKSYAKIYEEVVDDFSSKEGVDNSSSLKKGKKLKKR